MQFLAILLMLLAGEPAALRPGDHSRSLEVDGRNRAYLVHVPPQYDPAAPMPMVLAFHGGGGNANNMVAFSGLNEKADQAGFIVVYPEGSGRLPRMLTFNAGNCCGKAAESKIDDVAFTRLVLDDLERIANVDRWRVFATGMSNGAMMCYRLAAELSNRIAAIAPVAGPMGTKDCQPVRAVSVMHFHGDADEFAPFKGGRRHDREGDPLRFRPRRRGGRARGDRRWRANVARERATPAGLGRQHARHLRQRHDVGVLPAAPDEMMLSGRVLRGSRGPRPA